MHARNEHTSQVPAFVEVPVGLKIMPQNTPTLYKKIEDIRMRGVTLMCTSTGLFYFLLS